LELSENNVFTSFLLGTIIQDGSIRERSNRSHVSSLTKKETKRKIKLRKIDKRKRKEKENIRVQVYYDSILLLEVLPLNKLASLSISPKFSLTSLNNCFQTFYCSTQTIFLFILSLSLPF